MKTLLQARRELNLSQSELSRKAGVMIYVISHIESGKSKPRRSTKLKIEQALGESIDWRETLIDGILRSSKNRRQVF